MDTRHDNTSTYPLVGLDTDTEQHVARLLDDVANSLSILRKSLAFKRQARKLAIMVGSATILSV